MTFGLVHHSYSLPKGQAWKGVFFAPWYSYIVQSPSGWDATGLMFSNNHLQYDYSLCKLTNGIWVLNNENGQIYCFNLYCAACLDQTFFEKSVNNYNKLLMLLTSKFPIHKICTEFQNSLILMAVTNKCLPR